MDFVPSFIFPDPRTSVVPLWWV